MRAAIRKLLFPFFGLTLLGILIYRFRGMIHLEEFSGSKLWEALHHARLSLLLLSLVTIYAGYAVRALRWVRLSRSLGPSHFWSVYRMTLAGFASIFLLGRAGEPIRPLLIARKERHSVSGVFGIYVVERVFDTGSTAVLAAIGLLAFPALGRMGGESSTLVSVARSAGAAIFAVLLALIAFLVYLRFHGGAWLESRLAGWKAAGGWRGKCAGVFSGFSRGAQAIRTAGDLAAGVFYSACHWSLVALIYLWVPHSFGGRLAALDFRSALVVLAFTMMGSALQLPGVGGGSQVASFLAFTTVFGVEKEPAAAAAFVLWLITFAASSIAGVPLLIHEGMSVGELRRLAEAEESAAAVGAAPARSQGTGDTAE